MQISSPILHPWEEGISSPGANVQFEIRVHHYINVKRQIRKYYMSIVNTGKSLQQERIRLHKFADKIYHTTRTQP